MHGERYNTKAGIWPYPKVKGTGLHPPAPFLPIGHNWSSLTCGYLCLCCIMVNNGGCHTHYQCHCTVPFLCSLWIFKVITHFNSPSRSNGTANAEHATGILWVPLICPKLGFIPISPSFLSHLAEIVAVLFLFQCIAHSLNSAVFTRAFLYPEPPWALQDRQEATCLLALCSLCSAESSDGLSPWRGGPDTRA